MQRGFGSDNHAGTHPDLLRAITGANQGHAPSYGTDELSDKCLKAFSALFGTPCSTYFVFNGTAANVVGLRALCPSHESILCSTISHLNMDECGAPEFFTGAKLIQLEHENGILKLETLKAALIRKGDQHYSQPRVVSLTQPTELGTCYTVDEIRDICTWAHSQGLWVHIDGARIANAVVSMKSSFEEMFTRSGVDLVSFGGTKNGLLFGEAIVVLNPRAGISSSLKYLRKQSAQLPSKTRYVAAQFLEYIEQGLWRKIAEHSTQMAKNLGDELLRLHGLTITRPIQSNAVFVQIPQNLVKKIREKYFFYVWDEKTFECRLMCSWDTTSDDVQGFAKTLKEVLP